MNNARLIALLQELRGLLAQPDNDLTWSGWESMEVALQEVDGLIAVAKSGSVSDIGILLAPTGPAQEISLDSGWANEFTDLASRIEKELENS